MVAMVNVMVMMAMVPAMMAVQGIGTGGLGGKQRGKRQYGQNEQLFHDGSPEGLAWVTVDPTLIS